MSDSASEAPTVPEVGFAPTVPELLRRAVAAYPDDPFVLTATQQVTFAEVDAASLELADHLVRTGAGKGSRIGILLPQGPLWVIAFVAIARIGAVAAPLSTFSTPWEAQRALRLGDVAHLVTSDSAADEATAVFLEQAVPGLASSPSAALRLPDLPYLRAITLLSDQTGPVWATTVTLGHGTVDGSIVRAIEAEVTPADWLVIIFTSGTTSGPKAVVHSHGAQVRQAVQFTRLREQTHDDRFFAALPFFWVGGLTMALLPALYLGIGLVCQRRFEPGEALDLVQRTKPTLYMGWPHIPQRMRDHPSFAGRDLSDVPFLAASATGPAEPELMHNSLGMTETSAMHSMAPRGEIYRVLPEELRGSFGAPLPFVHHRIIDFESGAVLPEGAEGEICVRGYSLMVGLYKREREDVFDADGWYRTGDRGYLRAGLLFFTGRMTDMIKSAGSNVSAAEVELALTSIPDILAAVVVGLPDAERGQVVAAAVTVTAGSQLDARDIRERARKMLSVYKVPRYVLVLPEDGLPWLPSGKVDRRRVTALLAEVQERQRSTASAP